MLGVCVVVSNGRRGGVRKGASGGTTPLPSSIYVTTRLNNNATLFCNISERLHGYDSLSWLLHQNNSTSMIITTEKSKIVQGAILIHNEDPARFVPVMDNITGLIHLVITEVKESDSGDYYCIIRGLHKTWHVGEGIRLAIKGASGTRIPDVSLPLYQTLVTEPTENVTLPCDLSFKQIKPYQVSWFHQRGYKLTALMDIQMSKIMKSVIIMKNLDHSHFALEDLTNVLSSLVVIGVRKSDLGVYHCIVQGHDKRLHLGRSIKVSFKVSDENSPHPERALLFSGSALAALAFCLATIAAVKAANHQPPNRRKLEKDCSLTKYQCCTRT